MKRLLPALVLTLLAALPVLGAKGGPPITINYPAPRAAEKVTPRLLKGSRYVSTNDLARIFSATKYWRPEIQKLSLRIGEHTVRFTVDAPVVILDDDALNLVEPVQLIQGVVYAPESILGLLFDRGIVTDATWDDATRTVRFRSPVHTVRQAQLYTRGRVTEVAATLARGLPPRVLYATPTDILILFEGGTLDTARAFAGGVVTDGTIREVPGGVELRLHLSDDAKGYTVSVASSRFKVAVTDDEGLVEAGLFGALEPIPLGTSDRGTRIIVIDPGHGGTDSGEPLPGGTSEKDAALDIARALRSALTQRLGARVILTRDGDAEVTAQRRAEIANEADADLFVSIHLDSEGAIRGGGFRIYTLSPLGPAREGARTPATMPQEIDGVELRPWFSAQAGAVGSSMAFGQAIAAALSRSFPTSPVIVDAGRVLVVEPVVCPAILIESAPAARAGAEAMSLRGYTVYDYTQTVANAIEQFVRAAKS